MVGVTTNTMAACAVNSYSTSASVTTNLPPVVATVAAVLSTELVVNNSEFFDTTRQILQPQAAGQAVSGLITETITFSADGLSRAVVKSRTIAQTLTLGETPTRQAAKSRAPAFETITLAEALSRSKGKNKTISETLTLGSGTVSRQAAKTRTKTEAMTLSEAPSRQAAKLRTIAQALTLGADGLTKIKGVVRSIAQTLTLGTETLTRQAAKIRTKAETLTLGETPTRQAAKNRSLPTQALTLSGETLNRLKAATRTIAQALTLGAGSVVRQAAKSRAIAQSLTLAEGLARQVAKSRIISQALTLADTVSQLLSHGGQNISKSISETLTLAADSLTRQAAKNRSPSTESLTLSSSVNKSIGKSRSLPNQILTLGAGSVTRQIAKIRKVLESALLLTDFLKGAKNGIEWISAVRVDKGGRSVPYKKPLMPRIKQVLYPVYIYDERRLLERRRKLREYPPLVIIPAFKYNINQTVAHFIVTDPVRNKVYVRFVIAENRADNSNVNNYNVRTTGSILFSGSAIPIIIRPKTDDKKKIMINKSKAEFIMSQAAIQKYGNRLNKMSKVMKLWFIAQRLFSGKE